VGEKIQTKSREKQIQSVWLGIRYRLKAEKVKISLYGGEKIQIKSRKKQIQSVWLGIRYRLKAEKTKPVCRTPKKKQTNYSEMYK
ncbi:MAG: hypothetical protein IJT72_04720, partial [Lachnospiraceae bacterium]|nr:hypothetical protein [Lachnospiraceae bacterium]